MNHVDLREATHDMAITALRQTPAVVRLIVLRDESQFKDEGMLDEVILCDVTLFQALSVLCLLLIKVFFFTRSL